MRLMLNWLGKRNAQPEAESPSNCPDGFLSPQPVTDLLQPDHRHRLLQRIWRLTALPQPLFEQLYRRPIDRYAELVQLLPASEHHHHAHLGGILDHGLDITAHGLKLRQSYLLPVGGAPEDQSHEADA